MTLRRPPVAALLLAFALLAASFRSLPGQEVRDTLRAGHRAYDRVELDEAARLLAAGLDPAGGSRDSLWTSGVHKLADALLEQGRDTLAQLWLRWAVRIRPDLPVDSVTFPPRVARAFALARTAILGTVAADDSLAQTAWTRLDSAPPGRGALTVRRVPQPLLVIVEGVGTMLPGETRTLPAGSYLLRITADGFAPLRATREVVPGYATVVTPRLRRPTPAERLAAGGAPPRPALVVRGPGTSSGGAVTCTVLSGGAAFCWGDNRFGQLGGGAIDTGRGPVLVAGGEPVFVTASVGAAHACALTHEGKAWCWGQGASGQLGTGQTAASATPVQVSGGMAFQSLAAGGAHTCALTAGGTAFCWGAGRDGQLGNRATANSPIPVQVAAPAGVRFTDLAAGFGHTCALAAQGAPWCWGANGSGQLGTGRTDESTAPVAVQRSGFRALTAGLAHTCGIVTAGTAWCWGSNTSGQLGTGTVENSERPELVTGGLTAFSAIQAGDQHTCALTADGAAYCWGAGRAGQLGNGQTSDSPRPVLVAGGHSFRTMSAGAQHSCGTTATAVTWCWGDNGAGQLGGVPVRSSPIAAAVAPRLLPRAVRGGALPAAARDDFEDGDFTAGTAWIADSGGPGTLRLEVTGGALHVARRAVGNAVSAAGLTLPLRLPVGPRTAIRFDVRPGRSSTSGGCGLNCTHFPAVVRLRVRNIDQSESELWYAFGEAVDTGRSLGGAVIVVQGDAPAEEWLRGRRFTIREAAPRADTILEIAIGGIGTDFEAWFDNLWLPVPGPARIALAPDSVALPRRGATASLAATPRDSAGAPIEVGTLAWTSSDTLVAWVDTAGTVTAVGGGTATVTASGGGVSGSARVVVRGPRARPAAAPRRPRRP